MSKYDKLFLGALWCWILPLVLGILVAALSYFTVWSQLIAVGLVVIYAGSLLAVVGLILVTVYLVLLVKHKLYAGKISRIITGYSLLLLNFPVAFFLMLFAYSALGQSDVAVKNNSLHSVNVMVIGPDGNQYDFGEVYPGKARQKRFRIKGEGQVNYEILVEGKVYSGVLLGYITSGINQTAEVSIDRFGSVSVVEKLNRGDRGR